LELLQFFLLVVFVSASGALAPGPLLFATMNVSLRAGRYAGLAAALGHMAFELPLILAIAFGIWSFIQNPSISFMIGIVGSAALIAFGLLQARSSIRGFSADDDPRNSGQALLLARGTGLLTAFLVGLIFTALNPYFLMWWFTVGLPLISEGVRMGGLVGVLVMSGFHIWLDYAWLGVAGYATATGARFLRPKQMNSLSLALAIAVIMFGALLLTRTLRAV
jgi:threonine/homoserine/homoserine lactone efflux protein